VIDYACGNGFVTDHLLRVLPQARIYGVDSATTMRLAYEHRFGSYPQVSGLHPGDLSNLKDSSTDRVLCLGGLHHIQNQIEAITQIKRKVLPGGALVFVDFEDGTASQRYFDTLIHDNNAVGHIGLFFSQSRARNIGRACQLQLRSYNRHSVHWNFHSLGDLLRFVRVHHGLTCDDHAVKAYVESENMLLADTRGFRLQHNYMAVEYQV
jgi:ubiquinone/menaquinone biosynthesis C-methylase UbiE